MTGKMLRVMVAGAIAVLYLMHARPAAAVHLFPLFPGDPTGDCAAALDEAPDDAAAKVLVEGFFFVDPGDLDSTVEIEAGESVTWRWLRFCHSVTSTEVPDGAEPFGTFGGESTGPVSEQPELVKPEGDGTNFTYTFDVPGTYEYECVHHASVGMVGTVIVNEAV